MGVYPRAQWGFWLLDQALEQLHLSRNGQFHCTGPEKGRNRSRRDKPVAAAGGDWHGAIWRPQNAPRMVEFFSTKIRQKLPRAAPSPEEATSPGATFCAESDFEHAEDRFGTARGRAPALLPLLKKMSAFARRSADRRSGAQRQ